MNLQVSLPNLPTFRFINSLFVNKHILLAYFFFAVYSWSYTDLFPGRSDGKAPANNAGDPGSIPDLGRSPGERNGNPLQYSCLENPMYRGAGWATVHGVEKSQTRLSDFTFT